MNDRHEEKYLLDYATYAVIRARVASALRPDEHGKNGVYTISSVYYDDPSLTAYYDKEDGQAEHIKFRARVYDGDLSLIKLEKKIKRGPITSKVGVGIDESDIDGLISPTETHADELLTGLCAEMRAKGLLPTITVRYRREAFYLPGSDLRVTFDSRLTALKPCRESLADVSLPGTPVLGLNAVIMEIKYNDYLPVLAHTLCGSGHVMVSVSKYAMCMSSAYAGTNGRKL